MIYGIICLCIMIVCLCAIGNGKKPLWLVATIILSFLCGLIFLSISGCIVSVDTVNYKYVDFVDNKLIYVDYPTAYLYASRERPNSFTFIGKVKEYSLKKDGKLTIQTNDFNRIVEYFAPVSTDTRKVIFSVEDIKD